MHLLLIWLITYALPAGIAGGIAKVLPYRSARDTWRNLAVMHGGLVVSLMAMYVVWDRVGMGYPMVSVSSVMSYGVCMVCSAVLLGRLGLLPISLMLLTAFPPWVVTTLVVPVFVWCHPLRRHRYRAVRIGIFALWGVVCVGLYTVVTDVLLMAALHTAAGSGLIWRGVLYPDMQGAGRTEKMA